ncbi:MAG: BamA/TamA family outer membrane protein [Acidobacteria bacterium]|nr:BamA/TamA family outer membrane protein [Acidobacteriota bacterium]
MNFKGFIFFVTLLLAASSGAEAKVRPAPDLSRYEGRTVERVAVEVEGASVDEAAQAELRSLLRVSAGSRFSVVLVRESLQALFDTGRVANARVEASEAAGTAGEDGRPRVSLRFIIRPQILISDIKIELLDAPTGTGISADDIRGRLNLLEPGRRVSEQSLKQNADLIQVFMRDHGFYRATVEYEQQLDATKTRSSVTYRVTPGEPTLLDAFNIKIEGFADARVRPELKLQPGVRFTQATLGEDIARIRKAIIAEGYLAPRLGDRDIRLNSDTNRITVNLAGSVGPKVEVKITGYELKEKRQRELLPIKREGTIDPSAIVEGARRIRNRLQEEGYFFAAVTPVCAVVPPLPSKPRADALAIAGEEPDTCEILNPDELTGRAVNVNYEVERGRRFKLTSIRIEGTNKLSLSDVQDELRTREATVLGIIPLLGYGRGYTSEEALVQDRRTIEARMRDLGYRKANVEARRGVSLEGENLIITFFVTEGPLTRVADIQVRGNQIYTAKRLLDERCPKDPLTDESCLITGGPYSRSQARTDGERLRNFYARNGYFNADVDTATIELPRAAGSDDEQVRLRYTISESAKVYINRIVVNGLVQTKKEAILRAIPIHEGDVLRADQLVESERVLLNTTDAFRQVIIRTEQAGENSSGFKRRDVMIDVEERKRITVDYIVGYSTENGPLGGVEVRNTNLFGQLRQASIRTRFSGRQQLVRLEYLDPRFRRYGFKEFSPLRLSLQYQRDTSVTRFFRSTIDRGAMGIVQRFDEKGKLIDEFGQRVKEPSINRFTFNVETQRDLELVTAPSGAIRKQSTIVLRYSYEDVRLFNISSLLIAPVLRADQAIRLSRLGASFARDTRDRQFDPTRGDRLGVDYSLALKALGGNISFSKLLTSYQRYYKLKNRVRETVLAANVQFGLASLYNITDRDKNGVIDEADRRLPISERFFSGGSASLRGFGFEEAGPRVVVPDCLFNSPVVPTPAPAAVVPCGVFRDQKGKPVQLNPFTVPIGGNALAVVNLEARVGLTKDLQAVPFYDGGNVFQSVKDIFGSGDKNATDPRLRNLQARWTHTVGLGFRIKTPIGALGVDYGYLLNPPEFLIPQSGGTFAIHRLKNGQLHFRFGQTF